MAFPAYSGLDKLTPAMRYRVENFLAAAVKQGLSILITETWRSKERQEYLYSLGRTQPGNVVTWTLQSKHIEGEAIDIGFVKDGKLTYEGDWQAVAKIGEKNGLLWGGRWPTPDKPHFEFNREWQKDHWAIPYEKKLLDAGVIQYKKDLKEPPSRGELYVIINRLHNL